MAVFKRKPTEQLPGLAVEPIAAFWSWWVAEGRAMADRGVSEGIWDGFATTMSAQLYAVHPKLDWETAAGLTAQHSLVISAGGIAALRPLAERCLRAAPDADATWEYHAARQPSRDWEEAALTLGDGRQLALGEAQIAAVVDEDRLKTDVTIYHPSFSEMDANDRAHVAFLLLDWVLGEDGVERWVGEMVTSEVLPVAAQPANSLVQVTSLLQERAGTNKWALLAGTSGGAPMIASVRRPLTRLDNPLFDLHIRVKVAYQKQTAQGLPEKDDLDRLRALEGRLTDRLGSRGVLVAHESSRGVRTFHIYADHEDAGAIELVRDGVSKWRNASVEATLDPAWSAVRAFA